RHRARERKRALARLCSRPEPRAQAVRQWLDLDRLEPGWFPRPRFRAESLHAGRALRHDAPEVRPVEPRRARDRPPVMRRRFAPLATLIALLAAWAAPAAASCSAANTYNFSFSNQASATLNYANATTYPATTS